MKKQRNVLQFRVSIPFAIEHEGDLYVASCPSLDVVSQGETKKEATENLKEAVRLFIETAYTMGTLDDILRDSGFVPTGSTEVPPGNFLDVPLHLLAARQHAQDHAH